MVLITLYSLIGEDFQMTLSLTRWKTVSGPDQKDREEYRFGGVRLAAEKLASDTSDGTSSASIGRLAEIARTLR